MKNIRVEEVTTYSYVNMADRQRGWGERTRGWGRKGCKAPAVVVMKSERNCKEDDTALE
jgi:hypothetical protein